MPKHFLFVMWEGGGSVPPEIGLAARLVQRGHRVTVLAEDTVRPEAAAAGATFVGYEAAPNRASKRPEDVPVHDWELSDPIEMLSKVVCGYLCEPALGVARDVLRCHQHDPADVVAGCAYVLGAIIGAEKAGLPSVVLFPNLDFRPAPGRPGFGAGVTPDESPEARARDAQIWAATRQAFGTGQPALDRARRELDLPLTTHPWDEYDRAARVLLLTSRHFEYPYELPEHTLFAGPVLDDPAWATEQNWVPQGNPSAPLVLASFGSSFQDQLGVYQRVISALGSLPIRGIVTLGDVFDGGDLNVPDNVDVMASAPHGPILEQAAVMVTHGGHGSVLKSLAAGVPIVCLPLGRDQGENAAHIEWHGAGVRVDPTGAPDEIASAVSRVLNEASFTSVAARLRTKIQSEIAEDIAIRELELVSRNTPVATEA